MENYSLEKEKIKRPNPITFKEKEKIDIVVSERKEDTIEPEYVGKREILADGLLKACGQLDYLDDMSFQDLLYGKILRSTIAHGKILSIDTEEAAKVPGVKAIATWENTSPIRYNSLVRSIKDDFGMTEKIFDNVVRQYGDRVAAVAAETEDAAKEAIKKIKVEYEEYPGVYDPEEAYYSDIKVQPEGNRLPVTSREAGDVENAFREADDIIEYNLNTPMVHHLTLEPHVCVAKWDPGNELTVWAPQQGVFGVQINLCKIFELPYSKVRAIRTPLGGGFGVKVGIILEPICAELSRMAGRPVKIRLTREECMVSTWTRHSTKTYIRTALKEGKITGVDIRHFLNAGPHASNTASIPFAQVAKIYKLYNFDNLKFTAIPVLTNTPLQGAMRGFGSPQIFAALDSAVENVAIKCGKEPLEFRKEYTAKSNDYNYLDPKDAVDDCTIDRCIEKGKEVFDWEGKKLLPKTEGKYIYGNGIGLGVHDNGIAPNEPDITGMTLSVYEDGSLCLSTGICDHGGGSYTILRQIIGEILLVPPQKISVETPDTKETPYDLGAYASRNTWVGGNCAIKVANQIKEKLIEYAKEYLECEYEDVIMLEDGFIDKNNNKEISRVDLISWVFFTKKEKIMVSDYFSSKKNAGSYGAHFARVRIDTETGEVKIIDYVACCDAGNPINPMLLEGQVEGGIQNGIGLALMEELLVDKRSGRVLNGNLKKYKIPIATDMPENLRVVFLNVYEKAGPFGAKSIGEAATVPVAHTVAHAISDALGGKEINKYPITPEMILLKLKG